MKKALSIVLALALVLALCGSAFAAGDNLTMSYSTSIVNGNRVNIFEYRDAEGRLMREETDTLGSQGQLLEKKVYLYNEEGKAVSSRLMCQEDNGAWKNDEAVWTYNSDGSEIMDTRVVFTYPNGTQEFRVVQTKTDADGKSAGRGEGRDANGQKLYDITMSYDVNEFERVDTVKYSYPDGTVSTEYVRKLSDGTEINETINENAAGQIVKQTVFQQNPDGSYDRSSISTSYRNDGKRFFSQSEEYVDADGSRRTETISSNIDENGFGSGLGVLVEADGSRAIVNVEYRNDVAEGQVCATTYKYRDGTIDLRYEVSTPDGKKTTTMERDVQNYDGDDSEIEESELDALLVEEDPFDAWDEVFGDWHFEESDYVGDTAGLDSDGGYDYYETEVDWGDAFDWGGASDWSYDGGWDIGVSDDEFWDIASVW